MTNQEREENFNCKNCEIESKDRFRECVILQLKENITICEKEFYEDMLRHDYMAEQAKEEYERDERLWREEHGY